MLCTKINTQLRLGGLAEEKAGSQNPEKSRKRRGRTAGAEDGQEKLRCRLCKMKKAVDEFYVRKDYGKFRTECRKCLCDRMARKYRIKNGLPEDHVYQLPIPKPPRIRKLRIYSEADQYIDWPKEIKDAAASRRSDAIALPPALDDWPWLCARIPSLIGYACFNLLLRKRWFWLFQRHARRKVLLKLGKLEDHRKKVSDLNQQLIGYRNRRRLERLKNPDYASQKKRRDSELWKTRYKHKIYAKRKKRRATDPQYKISCNLRTYIFQCVGQKKRTSESRFHSIVGCSPAQLVTHLESKFKPGMSWSNYGKGHGKWSIDHIRPCASFDLTDDVQLRQCFGVRNMQPLWWIDNLMKSDKLPLDLSATL